MRVRSSTQLQLAMAIGLAVFGLSGCRGWTSESPPVHLNPNMDTQEKLKPYRASTFFSDGRAMRPKVPGTVARGQLKDSDHFYRGKVNGEFATDFPPEFKGDMADMKRGQERFNIYCSPCHARSGKGDGMVARRLAVPPPDFHQDRIRNMPVGEIFNVITHGKNLPNMPSYAHQVNEADRWRIIFYLRALQRSRQAVPPAPPPAAPSEDTSATETPTDGEAAAAPAPTAGQH